MLKDNQMTQIDDEDISPAQDWESRLRRAETLNAQGKACAMCGGTGGWPGLGKFVLCMPCGGRGECYEQE